jgi:hypothetical protein
MTFFCSKFEADPFGSFLRHLNWGQNRATVNFLKMFDGIECCTLIHLVFTFHLASATYILDIDSCFSLAYFYFIFYFFQERGLDCGMRVAATQERIQPHANLTRIMVT